MPSIVQVNVSQVSAPQPETLQQTGAFVSVGGTTLAPGTTELIQVAADLTSILKPAAAVAVGGLAWNANVVTVTTAAPHGLPNGSDLEVTIAGATPAGYNGTFLATVTGASAFTYPLNVNPGAETVPGTWVLADVVELRSMNTTFWAQGSQQSVYVLELGPLATDDAVAALSTWIDDNPGIFYSYLVPRAFADSAAYVSFVSGFDATNSLTYFFTTVTADNYTNFPNTDKSVVPLVETPGKPATEFSAAAPFWATLHYKPSPTNKLTPTAFAFLQGVTPYPTAGNQALLQQFKDAGINYIGTGAEGGISNTILLWGTTRDGRDFSYWYSVDWAQLTVAQAVANAVINGSNNPQNPLDYDQNGINRLQSVILGVLTTAVSSGLATGQVSQSALAASDFQEQVESGAFAGQTVVNAVPFIPYLTLNPADFAQGKYGGFSIVYIVARGFTQIIINIAATDFVTQ